MLITPPSFYGYDPTQIYYFRDERDLNKNKRHLILLVENSLYKN